ncbi:6454_t:CDS:2, partial [Racocetra fulgida]
RIKKEASYNHVRDYCGSNQLSGLLSVYNTIFKTIDLVLADHLISIQLLLQRAQMNQSLLYQEILVKEPNIEADKLLLDIPNDEILELWEVFILQELRHLNYII